MIHSYSPKRSATLLLFVQILLAPGFLWSQEESRTTQRLEWQFSKGAAGYRVEVVREGNINSDLFEYRLEVEESFVDLLLVPGTYYYKITVLNRFKKASASTDWLKLVIKAAKRPWFQYIRSEPCYEGDAVLRLSAGIANLLSDSQFILSGKEGEVIGVVKSRTQSAVQLAFSVKELEAGQYDLICRNPSGLQDVLEKALVIGKRIQPRVRSISRRRFYVGEILTGMTIKGNRFREGVRVEAPSDSGILISTLILEDDHTLGFWIDLTDAKTGVYRLTVINPSGLTDETRDITVLEYPEGSKPDVVKTGFGLVGRIPVVFGDIPDVNSPGIFTGFGVSVESDFGGFIPVLKWMGYSFFFEYKELGSPWLSDSAAPFKMTHYMNFGNSFYLTTRKDQPLNFFGEVGLGLSLHKPQYEDDYTGPDPEAMVGLYLMAGTGIDISVHPDVIFRMGGEIQFSYAEDGQHLFPEFYIELGYRFKHKRNLKKEVSKEDLEKIESQN